MSAVLFQFGLSNVVFSLERLGFFQLLFPFLLSLAIVYGVLSWAAKDRLGGKSPVALISIVISFFVMLYAATNSFIVTFLTQFSGVTLIASVGILFLIIVLGMIGVQFKDIFEMGEKGKFNWLKMLIILVVVFIVLSFFFGSSGFFPPGFLINNDFWTVVFFIIVLVVAVKFLGGEDAKPAAPAGEKKGG